MRLPLIITLRLPSRIIVRPHPRPFTITPSPRSWFTNSRSRLRRQRNQ